MSKEIRVNQKHLTLDNRIFIEKSLDNGMSFKDISKHISKDPTTISKEVKKHRQLIVKSRWNHLEFCYEVSGIYSNTKGPGGLFAMQNLEILSIFSRSRTLTRPSPYSKPYVRY
jgi:hypothetical protein